MAERQTYADFQPRSCVNFIAYTGNTNPLSRGLQLITDCTLLQQSFTMQFSIHYSGRERIIDVTSWKSTLNNRVEFYAVFADQQETFVNFVKRTDQSVITEVSSSADLTQDVKAAIIAKLIYLIQQPSTKFDQ